MCDMVKRHGWLTALIALLLVGSIVGHYVGDAVCDAELICVAESAETHPLHSSVAFVTGDMTPQSKTLFFTSMPLATSIETQMCPPLLRPPIAF